MTFRSTDMMVLAIRLLHAETGASAAEMARELRYPYAVVQRALLNLNQTAGGPTRRKQKKYTRRPLTRAKARAIFTSKEGAKALAKKYKCSAGLIGLIRCRLAWRAACEDLTR